MELDERVWSVIYQAIEVTWWWLLPIFLILLTRELWQKYIRNKTVNKIEWITLEVKLPREILKTPKAMEGVWASLYAIYSYGIKFWAKWWEGKIENWISFEMVGMNGWVHFFIRTPKDYKNLIQSSLFAQFPDTEINEVEDYMELLPPSFPNKTYDLWGTEFKMTKDEAVYPIKTYFNFEDSVEERRLDPVASLTETMSNLKEGEAVLFQILISPIGKPTGRDLVAEGKKVVEELLGKKEEKKQSGILAWAHGIGEFITNLVLAVFKEPEWSGAGEKKDEKKDVDFNKMTEGKKEVIKAVEKKISQLNFESTIRVIYIDRQDSFSPLNVAAIMGFFHQFNTQNMNGFKPDISTMTVYGNLIGKIFPFIKKRKVNFKKWGIYERYKSRWFGKTNRIGEEKDLPVLSAEELATIYHYPIISVESPNLERLSSKKGEPPVGLPTT